MIKECWTEIEGVRTHFLAKGEGHSDVVFLHGGSGDSASLSWRPTLKLLPSGIRAFAPDLTGYGKTGKPEIKYTVAHYVRFLHRFVQTLGLRQFTLVGLSLGGHVSLTYTLQFPDMIDRLVLVSSAGLGTRLQWRILSSMIVRLPGHTTLRKILGSSPTTVKLSLRNIVHNREAITDELVEEIVESAALEGSGVAWRSYLANELSWSGFRNSCLPYLAEIRVPTLIVHGSQDPLIPSKWAEQAHLGIPDSRLCLLSQCGHWPQREKPLEWNRVLHQFLRTNETPEGLPGRARDDAGRSNG